MRELFEEFIEFYKCGLVFLWPALFAAAVICGVIFYPRITVAISIALVPFAIGTAINR